MVVSGAAAPSATSEMKSLIVNDCLVTGIAEEFSTTGKTIAVLYPNPFTNVISIRMPDATPINTGKLIVYNLLGEIVISRVISSTETSISAELQKGVYYYSVTNANSKQTGKLIAE